MSLAFPNGDNMLQKRMGNQTLASAWTMSKSLTSLILYASIVSLQKFGFIKRVDKCWITTVKDLES